MPGSRTAGSHGYRIDLEGLESRTLLATIPAATATGADRSVCPIFRASRPVPTSGNANSPAVVIDPYDSQKLFAVWGVDLSQLSRPSHSRRRSSRGLTPTTAARPGPSLAESVAIPQLDPATVDATPPTDYTQVTDPSLAFDGSGQCLRTDPTDQRCHRAIGALYLTKFNFSGSTPTAGLGPEQRHRLPVGDRLRRSDQPRSWPPIPQSTH